MEFRIRKQKFCDILVKFIYVKFILKYDIKANGLRSTNQMITQASSRYLFQIHKVIVN